MARKFQKQKIKINCNEAINELALIPERPLNSKKIIRQWSINNKKNKEISKLKKNLYKFWYPEDLWPLDVWIVDYLRHQWTKYEDVRREFSKECYSKIHEYCLIMIEKEYTCFKNECVDQRKQKKKNKHKKIREKKSFKYSYKMPIDIETNMICRIVLWNVCYTMNDIIKNVKNTYNQKISNSHIRYSIEKGWIKYDPEENYFKITKKYPIEVKSNLFVY